MSKQWVLVVEDDAFVRWNLVDELTERGFEVVEASNAAEALGIFEQDPAINVLISDIHMPGMMDGLALVKCVRKRWPPVRIIVCSGELTPSQDDLPVGARFFSKPYEIGTLVEAMSDH